MERYLPLAAELYNNPDWHLVYTDGAETLFSRFLPENTTAIDLGSEARISYITAQLSEQFQHAPALYEEANTYLARFCLHTGLSGSAKKIMAPFTSPASILMKVAIHEQSGSVSEAQRLLEKLVADHRSFTEGRLQLALFYLRHNNKIEGVRQLSKVLKKDPFHRRARNVLYNLTKKQKGHP